MTIPTHRSRQSSSPTPVMGRRRFLQQLIAAGVLASCGRSGRSDGANPVVGGFDVSDEPTNAGTRIDARADGRILVVVNLQGGNDGPSTFVPAGASQYYDLRPQNAIAEADVLPISADLGLNPQLTRLHARGVAYVEGVGPLSGNLSHFTMEERWARGDVTGQARPRDGFLGRLTNTIADGNPLAGVSLAGTTPHFFGGGTSSLAIAEPSALWFLEDTDWDETRFFRQAMLGFDGEGLGEMVGDGYEILDDVAQRLAPLSGEWDESVAERFADTGDLGNQLMTAGMLIDGGIDTTVFYANLSGFDTHTWHRGSHDELMAELDRSVDAFLVWMDDIGRGGDVVIATTSEFGRRLEENGSGLDHGVASTMLLAGAVSPAGYGEASPFEDLDEDGNLRTTVGFDQYLGSLAQEWLGVDARSVLPNDPGPLGIW